MDTATIIEMHVKVHATILAMSGKPATESEKQTFRKSLQELVKLARIEFAQSVTQDMNQACAAMRGK